jgi:8-oxo-dGTP pyrophosphatase MutT (NUDIX family)
MGNDIAVTASLVLPYSVEGIEGFVYAKNIKDGLWGLPGGKIDPFENDVTAVLREVWEETGLNAKVVGFLGLRDFISARGSSICNRTYSGEVVGGKLEILRPEEISALDIFSIEQVRQLNEAGKLRPYLANLDPAECYLRGEVYPLSVVKSF